MKKIATLALSLIASTVFAKECVINTSWLGIREKPSWNSEAIGAYKYGEKVEILEEKDGFYRTKAGWISKKYCSTDLKKNKRILRKTKKHSKKFKKVHIIPQVVDTQFAYTTISLTDVSRITCPTDIKWFTYSKEKQIQIQKAGNNLLVKISPKVITENNEVKEVIREKFPRELLVECGGQVFTLILIPKEVPTQTIVLKPLLEDKKKALKFETANPYEETIKQLIRSAYKELPIDGYEVKVVDRPYKRFQRLDMNLYRVYKGAYYQVREYTLKAKQDINLHEKLFIPYLPENTVAIALDKLHLRAGEKGRLFVVLKEAK